MHLVENIVWRTHVPVGFDPIKKKVYALLVVRLWTPTDDGGI